MGFWRSLYYYMDWDYVSINDPDPRQKHLKYLCCEQIKKTDVKKMLTILSTANWITRIESPN